VTLEVIIAIVLVGGALAYVLLSKPKASASAVKFESVAEPLRVAPAITPLFAGAESEAEAAVAAVVRAKIVEAKAATIKAALADSLRDDG
jgi:type II secretory pathway pseudopilin PulG